MNTLVWRAIATAMLILGIPVETAAECADVRIDVRAEIRAVDFVFDGTVLRVDHVASDGTLTRVDDADLLALAKRDDQYPREYAATLEVHRFWKGTLSQRFSVYFVWNQDGPVFKIGQRQIVFARRQTEGIRRMLGIDPRAPQRNAWVLPCSGYASDDKIVLKQLGRARKPTHS